ncbi:MAG: aminotransferase class IV [Phenylobacterium sp.]|uniref:aminotransferase class IV n=1 Tax=Phenylobacterium sp. TaxID=1871053 RepID=UPI001B6F8819|nr:aminotransferase class IV [Phenylobacterium sp.]MBP7816203.1 aminotransferase class IV [Phenylobacterium sp.]MBP9232799.1 aminotransferase class IV [Phenylobacterium sp.]MBP9755719.1 aminotransferase class IV [Phenylobacterium sp.]
MIPLDDRGLLLGDGLFETMLWRAGELVAVDDHLERMAAGCAILGLPAPDRVQAKALMRQAVSEAGLDGERAAVRLTLTAGSGGRGLDRPETPAPRLLATAAATVAPTTPARLMVSAVTRNEGSPASRLKTLAYLDNVLARREARNAGADEAILLNGRGHLACAAAANLFWLRDGRVFTPALDCGVLDGIVRRQVMAAVAVTEVAAGLEALADAQAMFLTNSLIGVREVGILDGRGFEPSARVAEIAGLLGLRSSSR